MTPTKFRSCDIKAPFKSVRDAVRAAGRMNATGKSGKRPVAAYHCEYCQCWHVGHPMKQGTTGADAQPLHHPAARRPDRRRARRR